MTTTRPRVQIRRIYDEPARGDGVRVLVDRVWPRGLTKEEARIDVWAKEVAPSTQLRKWYSHKPRRFAEFRRRYLIELQEPQHTAALNELRRLARKRSLTLLTATKAIEFSQAAVLAHVIR
jgi:uncharacterized protein YeaO (DUF488 family)